MDLKERPACAAAGGECANDCKNCKYANIIGKDKYRNYCSWWDYSFPDIFGHNSWNSWVDRKEDLWLSEVKL